MVGSKNVVMVVESWAGGGTETYLSGLIDYLIKNSYDVDLVLLHRLNEKRAIPLSISHTITGFSGLIRLLYRNRRRVVHLHLYTSLLPAVLIAKIMCVPVVVTLHVPLKVWGLKGRILWRASCFFANTVVAVSRMVSDGLKAKNVYPTPISGGANSAFFHCLHANNNEYFNIAAVGRLEYQKNWEVLIQAVHELPQEQNRNTVINFYGNGSLKSSLKSLADRLGINVIFHGSIEREKLINALSNSSLAVLPSRFEGLPLSAMEGMAACVPTITSNFFSASDLIEHGETGHIFPVGDIQALTILISWHIKNPDDSRIMGEKGSMFVKNNYSEDKVYEPYLGIYSNVSR